MASTTDPNLARDRYVRSLIEHLGPALSEAGWEAVGLRNLGGSDPDVADATSKFVIESHSGTPEAVLICAPHCAPGIVGRGVTRARDAARLLGPGIGAVILEPTIHGKFEGLSYSVTPWQRPLANSVWRRRLQRMRVAPRLLRWLTAAVEKTSVELTQGTRDARIRAPLEELVGDPRFSSRVRRAGDRALARFDAGRWNPKSSIMHGDLWMGNILLPRSSAARQRSVYGFYLIDWAAAELSGFAFWDLVSVSISLGMPRTWVRLAARKHCAVLHCEPDDAGSYLVLAIADLRRRLEHMPVPRFAEDADGAHRFLHSFLTGDDEP